ncbi:MAG: cysteine synthase A [Lachnospiraceae bacterium]|nr:cysteine synthase A [Lachnospiraceae bacterium]
MIYKSFSDLIGRTPMVELVKLEKKYGAKAKILAKLEYFNPAGSAKDRVAREMILDAEMEGLLDLGSVIIEPTSGNTGIGLAAVAASRGYRVILTMPDTMSVERRNLLKAYGAEIVLTDGSKGMGGAIEKAEELAASIPGAFIPGQFTNPVNPRAHEKTTGPEIYDDCEGKLDYFIASVGTGGTLSGTGAYLKKRNPSIKLVAVEPSDSPVLSGGKPGPHKIQGIGAGFIPDTMNMELCDEIITVTTEQAYEMGRSIAREEGILVGISSGAAFYGALTLAKKEENRDKTIVVLFPDSGERYLSTPGYLVEE